MNPKWEYKVVSFSAERWTSTGLPRDLGERVDEFGAEGWELVGTEAIQRTSLLMWGGSRTVAVVAFFKRQRPA